MPPESTEIKLKGGFFGKKQKEPKSPSPPESGVKQPHRKAPNAPQPGAAVPLFQKMSATDSRQDEEGRSSTSSSLSQSHDIPQFQSAGGDTEQQKPDDYTKMEITQKPHDDDASDYAVYENINNSELESETSEAPNVYEDVEPIGDDGNNDSVDGDVIKNDDDVINPSDISVSLNGSSSVSAQSSLFGSDENINRQNTSYHQNTYPLQNLDDVILDDVTDDISTTPHASHDVTASKEGTQSIVEDQSDVVDGVGHIRDDVTHSDDDDVMHGGDDVTKAVNDVTHAGEEVVKSVFDESVYELAGEMTTQPDRRSSLSSSCDDSSSSDAASCDGDNSPNQYEAADPPPSTNQTNPFQDVVSPSVIPATHQDNPFEDLYDFATNVHPPEDISGSSGDVIDDATHDADLSTGGQTDIVTASQNCDVTIETDDVTVSLPRKKLSLETDDITSSDHDDVISNDGNAETDAVTSESSDSDVTKEVENTIMCCGDHKSLINGNCHDYCSIYKHLLIKWSVIWFQFKNLQYQDVL